MAGTDNSSTPADEWPFSLDGEQPAMLSAYTRSQAIEDGMLAELSCDMIGIEGLRKLCNEHFPEAHVCCTTAIFRLVEKAVNNKKWYNDWLGVFQDIFWMSRLRNQAGLYKLMITGTGRRRWHILKRVETEEPVTPHRPQAGQNHACITFMLPDED